MNRLNWILIAVAVVQIPLILFMHTRDDRFEIRKSEALLAGYDAAGVTVLKLYDTPDKETGDEKLALEFTKRGDDDWVVTSHDEFPAKATKLKEVLGSLGTMKSRGPIATSASTHNKFKVADKAYEKKVSVTSGGTEHVLYVGTSPKHRQVHVRLAGDKNTHAVSIGDIPVAFADWVDTKYMDIPKTDPVAIHIENKNGTFLFARSGTEWTLKSISGGADVTKADGAKIVPIVDKALKVTLKEAAGIEAKPKYGLDTPQATIRITIEKPAPAAPAGGDGDAGVSASEPESEVRTVEIGSEHDSAYYVRVSGQRHIVSVAKFGLDPIVNLKAADLFKDEKADKPAKKP